MTIELKRGVKNRFFILMISVSVLSVVLGYILLVTIDKLSVIGLKALCESVYTVYTQFGMLLFSPILIT